MVDQDDQFVKDSFNEISDMDKQRLSADESVRKAITSQETKDGVINFGGAEIHFRLFLSKRMRHQMLVVKSRLDEVSAEENLAVSEKAMYDLLGSICINPPWNDWQTWAYVDEMSPNTGGVQMIFLQIMSAIAQATEDVKNFRTFK
jgi:hypothetical protein